MAGTESDTMAGPQRMAVYADPKLIVVRGSRVVFDTLQPHGYRPVYIGAGLGGWTLDRFKRGVDRLPDTLAILAAAGHRVMSVAVEKEISSVVEKEISSPPDEIKMPVAAGCAEAQGSLW